MEPDVVAMKTETKVAETNFRGGVKRKRGRPPKKVQTEVLQKKNIEKNVKRKPGRRPKVQKKLSSKENVEEVVKRKRGRPSKKVQTEISEKKNVEKDVKSKRRRGPMAQTKVLSKKDAEEDVCFICFDGGDLVLCDRRDCPKAYHPDCVDRDDAFFRSKGRWYCGWHICSNCEKAARPAQYTCYTCTFSLCKGCIKEAEFLCVRGNRGFCKSCMTTVILIDKNEQGNSEMALVHFDDKNSWEHLFKDYWIDLKGRLLLTSDELAQAKNPWKGSGVLAHKEYSSNELYNANDNQGSNSDRFLENLEENSSKKRKSKRWSKSSTREEDCSSEARADGGDVVSMSDGIKCASKELLDFVAHMKNGSKDVLSEFGVQALLLEYIKQNNLRDPCRKSQIVCDSRLENLFGKACVRHFEMFKLLRSHFLVKEDTQGGVFDTEASQLEAEGNSEALTKVQTDKKHTMHEKGEEGKPQTNLDDYAAIDVHNINLLYLQRKLLEDLIEDTDKFYDKVVGSFIRIKIPGLDKKQDMHRLVQVVGIGRAAEPYKIGKRTTDVMLEVLNLNKTEIIPIDIISNQEFSEDECKCLQQSILCGFISRMTVVEVQEKARALQAVKVNDLRNTPEERLIPEVHTDPNADPNYGSKEDEAELDNRKQDNHKGTRDDGLKMKGRETISAGKEGSSLNDTPSGGQKNSTTALELSINMSAGVWDNGDSATGAGERTSKSLCNQRRDSDQANSWEKHINSVVASDRDIGTWNAQVVVRSGSSSESAPASYSTEVTQSSNISETDKVWHYQDPSGEIQGPFLMAQLLKWSSVSCFPANLRIWRTTEKQEDSILLTDALNETFHRELPQLENSFSQSQKVTASSDSNRANNWDSGWRESNNSLWTDEKRSDISWISNGKYASDPVVVGSILSSESEPASYSTGVTQSCNISETDKVWHYQDPSGNIQGPFSMAQLLKRSKIFCFPENLRIWRTNEKQEDSILLTDALNELPQLENSFSQPPKVAASSDNNRANNWDGGWRESYNSTLTDEKQSDFSSISNGKYASGLSFSNTELAKSDGQGFRSSGWEASTPEFNVVQPPPRNANMGLQRIVQGIPNKCLKAPPQGNTGSNAAGKYEHGMGEPTDTQWPSLEQGFSWKCWW